MIYRMYLFITKFIYYGYIGASQCVDFEASSIHNLIHAHMKRVNKFMKSDKTHTLWADDQNTKGMRRLAEFTELSRRMAEFELSDNYFFGQVMDDYRFENLLGARDPDPEYQRRAKIAMKKDKMKVDQLTKRYYTMLEKHVGSFWD